MGKAKTTSEDRVALQENCAALQSRLTELEARLKQAESSQRTAETEVGNFKERLRGAVRAACEGALARAIGLPLSDVANSRYAARSLNGDEWENGWQFIDGTAVFEQFEERNKGEHFLHIKLRNAVAEIDENIMTDTQLLEAPAKLLADRDSLRTQLKERDAQLAEAQATIGKLREAKRILGARLSGIHSRDDHNRKLCDFCSAYDILKAALTPHHGSGSSRPAGTGRLSCGMKNNPEIPFLESLRETIEQQYESTQLGSGAIGGCFGSILCHELHHGGKAATGLHFTALAEKWGIPVSILGELISDHCKRLEPLAVVNHKYDF